MLTLGFDNWDRGLAGHGNKGRNKFRDYHFYPQRTDRHPVARYDGNAFLHINHVWSTVDEDDNQAGKRDREKSYQKKESGNSSGRILDNYSGAEFYRGGSPNNYERSANSGYGNDFRETDGRTHNRCELQITL